MNNQKIPVTQAIRLLRENKVIFDSHFYKYEEKGGAHASARELGVDEHVVIKTLIMETDQKAPLVVLMHGDCEVSTKSLARELGVKSISPCDPITANKYSGYVVGGTSPFGTKKHMPVYIQKTILDLPKIYINGGQRGFLVSLVPNEIMRVLNPVSLEMRA